MNEKTASLEERIDRLEQQMKYLMRVHSLEVSQAAVKGLEVGELRKALKMDAAAMLYEPGAATK